MITTLLLLLLSGGPVMAATGDIEHLGGAVTYESPAGPTSSGATTSNVRVSGSALQRGDGRVDITVVMRPITSAEVLSVEAFEGADPANNFPLSFSSYDASTSTVTWTGQFCGPGSTSCPIGDLLDDEDLYFEVITLADGEFVGRLNVPGSSYLNPVGGGSLFLADIDGRFELLANNAVAYDVGVFPIPITGGGGPKLELFDGDPNQGAMLVDRLKPKAGGPGDPLLWSGETKVLIDPELDRFNRNLWFARLTTGSGAIYDFRVTKGILNKDRDWLSSVYGGHQGLYIDAGPKYSSAFYLIVSGTSGSAAQVLPSFKGSPLGLPVAPDALFFSTLANPAASPVLKSFGVLDPGGRADTSFFIPAGGLQIGSTIEVTHSAIIISPTGVVEEFSAPVTCEIRPFS
ncbi:MAG: hypothetical protein ACYSWX_09930 [Planctomycetota bacterium]|jgi:hypothetical protein